MKGIEVELTSLAGGSDVDMRKREPPSIWQTLSSHPSSKSLKIEIPGLLDARFWSQIPGPVLSIADSGTQNHLAAN